MSHILIGLCAGIVIGIAGAAYAAGFTYTTSWRSLGAIGGHSYENAGEILVNYGSNAQGGAWIRTVGGATVPPHRIGTQPFLYFSSGTLCKAGTWYYNPGYVTGVKSYTPSDCGPAQYNANGETRAQRSDGTYKQDSTYYTPSYNQNS